jgi:hypothetical protein
MLFLFLSIHSYAQIICIKCFQQNDSIGYNVNNLIVNGGFENNTCIPNSNNNTYCPNATSYNCDIANWTCTGGGAYTYASFYDSTYWYVCQGIRSPYFGNSFCEACSPTVNDTSCLQNIDCTVTGLPAGYPVNDAQYGGTTGISLAQTVNGLTPGLVYVLEFWAGGEGFIGSFPNDGMFAVDVGFGNTFLRCNVTPASIGVGKRYIIEFIANSPSHTIKFTNWGHICSSCTELILDDVKLYKPKDLPSTFPSCGLNVTNGEFSVANVYPNPASDRINVEINSGEDAEIIIYDITSRQQLKTSFNNSTRIDIEKLESGIYFYVIHSENGFSKTGQFVKK